jgi:hypothetical protein
MRARLCRRLAGVGIGCALCVRCLAGCKATTAICSYPAQFGITRQAGGVLAPGHAARTCTCRGGTVSSGMGRRHDVRAFAAVGMACLSHPPHFGKAIAYERPDDLDIGLGGKPMRRTDGCFPHLDHTCVIIRANSRDALPQLNLLTHRDYPLKSALPPGVPSCFAVTKTGTSQEGQTRACPTRQ